MKFGCVVLTQGGRPEMLNAALDSLLKQRDVEVDVVVVGNGWQPTGLPDGVRGVGLAVDEGIPAGRNAGVPHTSGELLFFLDDDARIVEENALSRVGELFDGIGLVQLRVDPLEDGRASAPRDWSPRLRARSRLTPGDATLVWEGAVAMPRRVFDAVGGWPSEFRFVHEGVDLAWRVLDAGYRVHYAADLAVLHPLPVAKPARHGYSRYYGARNRVWLARRHLPLPLGVLYVASFALRTLPLVARSPEDVRPALRGYRDGMRQPCGPRRPLGPRTLWRMTRAGRPPVV